MPVYQPGDYEQVLARIRSKAAASGIAMGEVLSEEEIACFEERHHVHLPQAYRMFLKEVGSGCGILMPQGAARRPGGGLHSQHKGFTPQRPCRCLKIGMYRFSSVLTITGQCRGEVWSFTDVGVQPCCERQDFPGWFEL